MAAQEGEQRVTLALLAQKLDQALERLDRIDKKQDEAAKTQIEQALKLVTLDTTVCTQGKEIEKLRERDSAGNIITGAMAIVAGVIGAIFKP